MQTKAARIREELNNLPEVEYPPEVVDRWVKEGEIALQQYATGELLTMAEFAAKHGLKYG